MKLWLHNETHYMYESELYNVWTITATMLSREQITLLQNSKEKSIHDKKVKCELQSKERAERVSLAGMDAVCITKPFWW